MLIDRDLLRQAGKNRLALYICILCGFAVGLAVISQAYLISQIVQRVFLGRQSLEETAIIFYFLIAVVSLRAGLVWIQNIAASRLAAAVKSDLRKVLYRHLIALGPAYLNGEHSGEINAAAIEGIEGLDAYFSQYVPQIVLAALVPLSIAAMIFPRDGLSAGILLITAPLLPIFMALIGSIAQKVTGRQWKLLNHLSAAYLDTIQGLTTLKLFDQSERRGKELDQINEAYRLNTLSILRVTFLSAFVLEFIATISTAIVAVEIGIKLLYSQIPFDLALFILILTPEFYLPLRTLGLRFHAGMTGSAAARKIFEILALQPAETLSRDEPISKMETQFPIRFDKVTYQYPKMQNPTLDQLCFEINRGEKIALVGISGSGKSTIIQLLMKFLQPQEGKILVGGIPLNDIPQTRWMEQIGWVSQTPYLFNTTLGENLRLGKPGASQGEIDQAARWSGMEKVIQELPKGYDTPIGEGGLRLSAGQAQRLALARAFLKNAPFLILDEPTSYLDPELEADLQRTCYDLMTERTVLIIAHRLTTVYRADRILVLNQGRIAEMGTFLSLAAADGLFSQLIKSSGDEYAA